MIKAFILIFLISNSDSAHKARLPAAMRNCMRSITKSRSQCYRRISGQPRAWRRALAPAHPGRPAGVRADRRHRRADHHRLRVERLPLAARDHLGGTAPNQVKQAVINGRARLKAFA